MNNTGCIVIKNFKRPSKELIRKFAGFPVANIDDCLNRLSAIDGTIRPIGKSQIAGCAFTVKVPEGDNLMFHQALDMAQEGDVIMIDAGGTTKRSIFGEIMITYLKQRKIAGVIVDGAIRDLDSLSKMDFPIYAKGITPDGPYKNGPGEINTPIVVGGRIVCPGDIIVGDADGVIIIKPDGAEELAKKVEEKMAVEKEIIETILSEGTYNRPWVKETLRKINCEFID